MGDKHLNVVIVGGSLSGLFAALAVRDLGHSAHILERYHEDKLTDQGAGLRIGPDVYAFLAQYVSKAELDSCMVVGSGSRILDRQGQTTHEVNMELKVTGWGTLHRICIAKLRRSGGDRFIFDAGCTVEGVTGAGEKVDVEYSQDGTKRNVKADLVIGADGQSSRVRQCFLPDVKRTYVGYACWRGLVPESSLSSEALAIVADRGILYWGEDFMIPAYLIPGYDASVEIGKRLVNWVWYHNVPEGELDDLMTDKDGFRHKMTVPIGKMQPHLAARQKSLAAEVMPPQLAEMIEKTEKPFVQLVTDMVSPLNSFLRGRVMLVGDSVAGPRPHVATSTSQAVYHVSKLKSVLEGNLTEEKWANDTGKMSRLLYEAGRELGSVSQSTAVALADKYMVFTRIQGRLYREIAAMSTA
jgi:2-polyprenyl-6-methoxyphenol hydroxylase-like FAD-dependent oxidoreductase